MSDPVYTEIAKAYTNAAKVASGLKARLDKAGFNSADISSLVDLSQLPVMKKKSC